MQAEQAGEVHKTDRVTIRDVARVAGVSYGTVSRVLNGGQNVSAVARQAVEGALHRTGFVPNYHARRLAGAPPDAVAFLHCVDADHLFADLNVNAMLLECTRVLGEHGIMLAVPVGVGGPPDTATRQLHDLGFGAALLFSARQTSDAVTDLIGSRLPVVACGTPLGREAEMSYVTGNDRDGARQMVCYLQSRGRRRIATVTGPMDLASGVHRLAGYHDALAGRHQPLIAHGDYSYAGGVAATERLLHADRDFDALFVASDVMAAGAMTALARAGRRVPEDVAVAGFDDAPVATTTQPQLTTVRVPWSRITDGLVRLLLRSMAGDELTAAVLPVELVVRGSA